MPNTNILNINPNLVRRILVNAIRHTGESITGNACGRWVVNLSGGLDSAIVAFLAAEAWERRTCAWWRRWG